MSGDRASPSTRRCATRSPTAIATITLDRPDALNALTIPMKIELLAAFRRGRARPGRAGGRADRRRPGVLCRPGPQGTARARCGAARRRGARALQPDHPGDARRSTSRSSGRSTAWPPAPAPRSRSPATSGSRPRVRASSSRSGGSGSCRTAARRGSCHGSSGRPRPPSWRCSASRCRAADAERFGLVARVVPADDAAAEARAVAARLAGLAPLALAQTKRALERSWSVGPRDGARGRGVPPGRRRRHGRPRRGPRRRSSRSGRRGSPGSSARQPRALTPRTAGS